MASCNLNDSVRFKLTPRGEKILKDYLAAQQIDFGCNAASCYRKNECGYVTCALWEFMNVFGPHIAMGFNLIIEENTLIFCGCY
jgi:hypothetical protein